MPAFVGTVQILNIGGGNVQFGDALNVSPKSNSKTTFRFRRRKHRCIRHDKQWNQCDKSF